MENKITKYGDTELHAINDAKFGDFYHFFENLTKIQLKTKMADNVNKHRIDNNIENNIRVHSKKDYCKPVSLVMQKRYSFCCRKIAIFKCEVDPLNDVRIS